MLDETTRRSFFSALALSPLALLGWKKTPEEIIEINENGVVHVADKCKELNRLKESEDYWRERALATEKKLRNNE